MRGTMISMILVLLFALTSRAQEVGYLGKTEGTGSGLIELEDGDQWEVREGDQIPNLGTVTWIGEEELVVRQSTTEEERQALRSQGRMVYDALELHLIREDLRVQLR